MYQVKPEDIKILRERTKLGLSECKSALEQTEGDIEKSIEFLKKKGLLELQGGKDRKSSEGLIFSYIHTNGRIGVLLEVNCETDFVARTDEFKQFCKDVAMQIAGNNPYPLYVDESSIELKTLDQQTEFFRDKTFEEKKLSYETFMQKDEKQKKIIDGIISGRLNKWKKEVSLMDQKFIKDPTKDIKSLLSEIRAQTRENIVIKRFTRYELGVS